MFSVRQEPNFDKFKAYEEKAVTDSIQQQVPMIWGLCVGPVTSHNKRQHVTKCKKNIIGKAVSVDRQGK